jgi:hypothetical protein
MLFLFNFKNFTANAFPLQRARDGAGRPRTGLRVEALPAKGESRNPTYKRRQAALPIGRPQTLIFYLLIIVKSFLFTLLLLSRFLRVG